jgi:hypothetical protein
VAAEYVYTSTLDSSSPANWTVTQLDSSLAVQGTQTDVAYCAVANDKVWSVGRNTNLGYLYSFDVDDITTTIDTTLITASAFMLVRATNDRLYVAIQGATQAASSISRIDPADGSILWTTTGTYVGSTPNYMTDDGQHVYSVGVLSGVVSLIKLDIDTGIYITSAAANAAISDLRAFDGDLYAMTTSGDLLTYETTSLTNTATVSISASAREVTDDGTDLLIGYSSGIRRYDTSSASIVETASISGTPLYLAHSSGVLYGLSANTPSSFVRQYSTSPIADITGQTSITGTTGIDIDVYGLPVGITGWFVGTIAY